MMMGTSALRILKARLVMLFNIHLVTRVHFNKESQERI